MDKCREQFEEWAKDKYILEVSKYGGYRAVATKNAFDAWKASRQALVVDVGALPSASYTDDGVVYRSHVESALDFLGVSTK